MKNYEITEEQIKENKHLTLEQYFKEVFGLKIKTGWYKHTKKLHPKWINYYNAETNENFGIGASGNWLNKEQNKEHLEYIKRHCKLAYDSEVLEALTNEAKKRGFKEGVCFNIVNGEREPIHIDKNARYGFDNYGNKLLMNNWCIFENGKWAEIVKTYTKEEAEKILNAKIV